MKAASRKTLRSGSGETSHSARMRQSNAEPLQPLPPDDDDDLESELPIRGRPSKKLLLLKQRAQYQVELQPELKTVAVAAAVASPIVKSEPGARPKAKRSLYKKGGSSADNANGLKPHAESYIMRLFERSLDLSKYKENTPLYPVCRAWMANAPRNHKVAIFNTEENAATVKRDVDGQEMLEKLRNGELKTVDEMPAPLDTDLPVIPPFLELTDMEMRKDQNLYGANKKQLLNSNLRRWKNVRNHWLKHAQQYEHERYAVIDEIMDAVCKN